MADKIVYISKKQLLKAVGEEYLETLKELQDQNLLKSYEEVYAITFETNMATHIQAALEFYEIQGVLPITVIRKGKK